MESSTLLLFKDDSKLGDARAGQLFRRLSIFQKEPGIFPRNFEAYEVAFDEEGNGNIKEFVPLNDFIQFGKERDLGNGVTLIRRI